MTKTGDKRFAGTDANVFIQLVGEKGMTQKMTLDNPKNNFERNMTDNFEVWNEIRNYKNIYEDPLYMDKVKNPELSYCTNNKVKKNWCRALNQKF